MAQFLSDPFTLSIVVMGVVGGHLMLLLLARVIHPVVLLSGTFLLLAMVSAMLIPGAEMFKWGRLYVAGLSVVLGVFVYRQFWLTGPALAMFAFLSFYVLAGLWCDVPRSALMFKGLAYPTYLTGALLALTMKSERDIIVAMRVLVVFCLAFAVPTTLQLFNPGSFNFVGRFDPWGISPNKLGGDGSAMLLIAMVIALFDKNVLWKAIAYATGTLLAVCILYSGSRAGAGQAAIAAAIMGLPLFKRPLLPIMLGALSAVLLVAIMPDAGPTAYERLGELDFTNRSGEWGRAIEAFRGSPIIGQGWIYTESLRGEPGTANAHSIYLQVLAETGLLGMALLAAMLVYSLRYAYGLWRISRARLIESRWCFVAIAMGFCPFLHGLAEASTITGASINLFLVGLGFTIMTRLKAMAASRAEDGLLADSADEYAEYSYAPEHAGAH